MLWATEAEVKRIVEAAVAPIKATLDQVLAALTQLKTGQETLHTMAVSEQEFLDRLTKSAQQTTDAEQSAINLLTTLTAEVRDALAAKDYTAAAAKLDAIDASTSALAAAIVANTPAASTGTTGGGTTTTNGGTTTGTTGP